MGRPHKHLSIEKIFLASLVLTLEQLCTRLRCSRSTILRRLKEYGYYCSYDHAGKYITIRDVAQFDSNGLWVCKGARFSKHGTLKDTVDHYVQGSKQGMTHEELGKLLGVRAHNTLLDLVTEGRIQREKLGPTFVYLSRKRSIQAKQARQRKSYLVKSQKPRPTSRQKIATLLELIKYPRAERQDIVRRCKRAGVTISRDVVDTIFEAYDLDKKRAL